LLEVVTFKFVIAIEVLRWDVSESLKYSIDYIWWFEAGDLGLDKFI
jgi:hypothetical protein